MCVDMDFSSHVQLHSKRLIPYPHAPMCYPIYSMNAVVNIRVYALATFMYSDTRNDKLHHRS